MKTKRPTAKQSFLRMVEAEGRLTLSQLQRNEDMKNASVKFDMIVKMFDVVLVQASTIGEARRWYTEWVSDVNGAQTNEELEGILTKHGFEFSFDDCTTNLFCDTV